MPSLLGIGVVRPSEATCLPANCCFSETKEGNQKL